MKMSVVYLTCANGAEADKIIKMLLDKKLVACAKTLPISSQFLWQGKKDKAIEVLVMFETLNEKFDEIQKEVKKIHSYETPMLFSIEVSKTTESVSKWLKEVLI